MNYSLIMVGAHDGSKTKDFVNHAATIGPVLLFEPVPYLFERLAAMHAGNTNVQLVQAAVAVEDAASVAFYAPTPEANTVRGYGDQLGSFSAQHAAELDPAFADKVVKIETKAISFATLLRDYDVGYVDTLMTDTEGYDAKILATFPFRQMRPRQVIFEYKHSDGVFHIGKNFAHLLSILEAHGYRNKIMDEENCVATRQD